MAEILPVSCSVRRDALWSEGVTLVRNEPTYSVSERHKEVSTRAEVAYIYIENTLK